MFTDVKAARSTTWLARGYQDGLFTLSLTVNINIMLLFCSSFHRLCLTQATQLRITQRRHLRRSWILFTDKTLPKLSLHHRNRVWGSHLLDSHWSYYMINHSYWSCHMINVGLVSPSKHGFLTLLRDLRRVGDDFFLMITVWLAPLAEDAEDSFMFSRSFAFAIAFASSWFVFAWSQSLGCFLRSTRTQHGRCLSTFIV